MTWTLSAPGAPRPVPQIATLEVRGGNPSDSFFNSPSSAPLARKSCARDPLDKDFPEGGTDPI